VRIGNVSESLMTTLLLQMVQARRVNLDDKVAKWFPDFPEADQVTLKMLATSTSGYADFVTSDEFGTRFEADPFHRWTAPEILAIARSLPPVFAPGTSWAFSDTNFVLLGQILQRVGRKPYSKLVQRGILDRAGMRNTAYTTTAAIPEPVLHAYSNERGKYEEATYWSPTWVLNAGTGTSNLADLLSWARVLGTGSLLSKRSHELQVGDENVGLGPLTEKFHYAMGAAVVNDWILANPQIDGYTGVVAYLPAKHAAVAVSATFAQGGDISVQYAGMVFNAIAALIDPAHAPNINVCPRGC
jgi:D-alanyl-D-alanine carboxypeptidase